MLIVLNVNDKVVGVQINVFGVHGELMGTESTRSASLRRIVSSSGTSGDPPGSQIRRQQSCWEALPRGTELELLLLLLLNETIRFLGLLLLLLLRRDLRLRDRCWRDQALQSELGDMLLLLQLLLLLLLLLLRGEFLLRRKRLLRDLPLCSGLRQEA